MKSIDFEKATHLLKALQLAAANGAMFGPIMSEAIAELKTINADAQSNQAERAEEAQANESKARQKVLDAKPTEETDKPEPPVVTRPVSPPPSYPTPPAR